MHYADCAYNTISRHPSTLFEVFASAQITTDYNAPHMDLILRQARVRGHDRPVDIGVHEGLITKIAPKIAGRDHDFVSLKELGLM